MTNKKELDNDKLEKITGGDANAITPVGGPTVGPNHEICTYSDFKAAVGKEVFFEEGSEWAEGTCEKFNESDATYGCCVHINIYVKKCNEGNRKNWLNKSVKFLVGNTRGKAYFIK